MSLRMKERKFFEKIETLIKIYKYFLIKLYVKTYENKILMF